jgi:hypothetical protein
MASALRTFAGKAMTPIKTKITFRPKRFPIGKPITLGHFSTASVIQRHTAVSGPGLLFHQLPTVLLERRRLASALWDVRKARKRLALGPQLENPSAAARLPVAAPHKVGLRR